jgi:hypothetical protein
MLVLAATTAVLLAVDAATPPWLIALILSGRGLALGLTIQPLLLALTGGLAPAAAADANTLFNIVERLAGSLGIALLATFFQVREQAGVGAALHALGIDPALLSNGLGGASGAASGIPPIVQARLGDAATAGFHDVVLALVVASVVGIGVGLLLREGHSAVDAPTVSS